MEFLKPSSGRRAILSLQQSGKRSRRFASHFPPISCTILTAETLRGKKKRTSQGRESFGGEKGEGRERERDIRPGPERKREGEEKGAGEAARAEIKVRVH